MTKLELIDRQYFVASGLLCFLYVVILYFGAYQEWGFDFYSYYASAAEFLYGKDPYHIFFINNVGRAHNLWMVSNPNPPVTLLLFSVLTHFYYTKAFVIWAIFSGALGLLGVYKTFLCFYPQSVTKKSIWTISLIYLATFPVIMNTAIGQWGGVLLFLLANGYDLFLQKKEMQAGFWWGLLIAIKLFPGLLLIYAVLKKRYRLFFWLLGFSVLWTLLPLLITSAEVYRQYLLDIKANISWYGFNWNASILGFLFRLFVGVERYKLFDVGSGHVANMIRFQDINQVFWIKSIFFCMFFMALTWFILFFKRISGNLKHKDFAFLVVFMLLLSPFGWTYYFPILLIPLVAVLPDTKSNFDNFILFFICLFLLYFPMPATHNIHMKSLLAKISVYSFGFYGLLLLAYLTLKIKHDPSDKLNQDIAPGLTRVFIWLVLFGLSFVLLRAGVLTFLYST